MKKILIIILIFIFSISLRLWNLDQMGRTWDESAYVEYGYKFLQLVKKGDFTNAYWYKTSDEPPLVRYIYAVPSYFDVSQFSPNGNVKFKYDYTYSRIVSAIASSVSVIFVVLVGWELLSPFIGVIAGVIFSMLPFYLGLSQLATLESFIMLFFTSSIYFFLKFLKKFSLKFLILSGISIGLALQTKYTNILLIPLIIGIYYIWYFNTSKKGNIFEIKIMHIFLISLFVLFILWPMPWFHLKEVIEFNFKWRILGSKYSIPEVFFGRLMLVPKIYYVVHFLITTPILLLILFIVGFKTISFKKNWILYVLAVWFLFPFIQSLYNFRQHGVRYIIEIYAPLSLLAAIGFDSIVSRLTKKIWLKFVYFIPIFIYLVMILLRITPYYLDYFNEVVGGTKNVYEKELFQLGWWGQGMREAGLYIKKNAASGSQVAVVGRNSFSVMPSINNMSITKYEEDRKYDYVVVSYFQIVREGFSDIKIKNSYSPVYNVLADGADLVRVYKIKNH